MEIEHCRKFLLESTESLYQSCLKVGGAIPELDMTLREFIESYGWNGVVFSISKDKKIKPL